MQDNTSLEIPDFMNKRNQQKVVPIRPEVQTANGTVRNINAKKIREAKKLKLQKRIITLGLVAVIGASAFGGYALGYTHRANQETPPTIPTGYILTETTDMVRSGDSVYNIALEYYNENLYSGLYSDINEFTEAILKANGLTENSTIYPGDTLTVPVVTSGNNEYFLTIQDLENQIEEITSTNYWVEYTAKFGDTYSALAAKASGSSSQTIDITQEIIKKNAGASHSLRPGDTIWIVNPELGTLRCALKDAKAAFQDSVKNSDENQNSSHIVK